MKIVESAVQLAASHRAYASQTTEVAVETKFHNLFSEMAGQAEDQQKALRERVTHMLDTLLSTILAALEGKKCPENVADEATLPSAGASSAASSGNPGRQLEWQVATTHTVCEFESSRVCGQGTVKTADGKNIDFKVALGMERSFRQESRLDEAGNIILKDPLVINFNGAACELTEQRFDFDLDADGVKESLPGLGQNSGYLVFDRNGNGAADNGSELFGTASGDAFGDLAKLDSDGNGWLDEADPAFARLSIWSGGGYASLAERGVGALHTGSVESPFAIKTADNRLLGEIRSAGVYLSENGQAGTLQQVDLAVSAPPSADQKPEQRQHLATQDNSESRLK